MEEFIDTWQTLIGSALGPFLAVILSTIGFWIKSILEKIRERKEFLRRIEIGVTRSFDDTIKTRLKLQYFVTRLRTLILSIKEIKDIGRFSLDTINFPAIRYIYTDTDLTNFKTKSFYLHNKILQADSGIKEMNEMAISLKNDFVELQRKNELHILLIRQNQTPDATPQRAEYAHNLELFANAIDEYVEKFMKQNVEILTQIKIYNKHLRKRHGHWFLWKCEKTKFKYFRNKTEQRNFSMNIDSMERIDRIIQEEVEDMIKTVEDGVEKL